MNSVIAWSPEFIKITEELTESLWLEKLNIVWDVFKDGWPNIFINDVENKVEGSSVFYIWDISSQEKLFWNISIIQALAWYYAERLNVILPFFPVWTMERVDKEWQIATAKTLFRLLGSTPMAMGWKTKFHFLDIHDLHERFYSSDSVAIKLHTAMDLLKERILDKENIAIAFPDEGAKKRFWKDFKGFEIIECIKERVWDKRAIRITEWDAIWKNVIIVDDLIQSWGTIIECATELRKIGAHSVSAYATHAVCTEDSHINLARSLDTLYTTNTLPKQWEKLSEITNIEVLNIKVLLKRIIKNELDNY